MSINKRVTDITNEVLKSNNDRVFEVYTKYIIRREKCIDRKFLTDDDIENFCYELEGNALEGLSSCVCELGLVPFWKEKTHPYYKRPSFPSQLDEITTPKWKVNLIQERENKFRCTCRVPKKSPRAIQWNSVTR